MKKLEGLANFSRKPPLPIFCCVHVWLAKNAANCNKRLALCCVQGFTTLYYYFYSYFLLCATFEVTPKKWRKLTKKASNWLIKIMLLQCNTHLSFIQNEFFICEHITLPLLISLIDMLLSLVFCHGNFTDCCA